MPSLRLPIVINREIDNALKRVSESTRIPVSTLARDAIIDMLARHGEIVEQIPKPGGNRYKIEQDVPSVSTIEQDKSTDTSKAQDTPVEPTKAENKPTPPKRTSAPTLAERTFTRSFSKADQVGSNGKRRNGASAED